MKQLKCRCKKDKVSNMEFNTTSWLDLQEEVERIEESIKLHSNPTLNSFYYPVLSDLDDLYTRIMVDSLEIAKLNLLWTQRGKSTDESFPEAVMSVKRLRTRYYDAYRNAKKLARKEQRKKKLRNLFRKRK